MNKEKAKKKNVGQIIFTIIILLAGMVCGGVAGWLLHRIEEQGMEVWIGILVLFLSIYGAMLIQIIVHEAGHLVFGLVSGYEFSSFRIGNFMFLKENGKIKLRKLSIAGTAGQCLMAPPDLVDGKMPVTIYNLGGCILNVIVSAVFGVLVYFRHDNPIELIIYVSFIAMGLAFALSNGIPMQVGDISNDGYNAFSLSKNPKAMHAFWLQLKINEQQAKGIRLKNMPENWFQVPNEEDMNNELVAAVAVFHENWLMDQGRVEEALDYITELLSKETSIIGLHRNLLICDRIYCELVVKKNTSEAIQLHDKAYKTFVKQMKNFPSIIRTEYAYALLAQKDQEVAEKCLKQFEKVAKTYPYPVDIISERELINLVKM